MPVSILQVNGIQLKKVLDGIVEPFCFICTFLSHTGLGQYYYTQQNRVILITSA